MVRGSVLRLLVGLALLAAVVLPALSQTKLDLQHQARGIDFTGSTYTKPVRMGSVLPSTCTTGEGYLLSSAPAGSNLYFCLAPNVWVLQGTSAGSGSSGTGALNSLATTASGNVLTIGAGCSNSAPCNVRLGSTVYAFTNQAIASLGAGSGTAYVYVDQNGVLTVGSNGIIVKCSSGCTPVSGVTSMPASGFPIASVLATNGAWGPVTDLRAPFTGDTPATVNSPGTVLLPSGATSNALGTLASGVQSYVGNTIVAYGATGNGSTNDAPAINSAIAATPSGGTLYVPPGSYYLDGSGPELILIDHSITLQCAGWGSTQLVVAYDVPNTTDVIHVHASGGIAGLKIKDCEITSQFGAPARYGLFLDSIGASNSNQYGITNFDLDHNYIVPLGSATLAMTQANSSAGIYDGIVQNNLFAGPVITSNSGDSIRFINNQLGGAGPGITLNSIGGAYGNVIQHNSITNCSGAIVVTAALFPQIIGNEIEAASGCAAETNGAAIDIIRAQAPKIINNQINPQDGFATTKLIRIDTVDSAQVQGNECQWSSPYPATCVTTTGNATNTFVGVNHLYPNGPSYALLSDSGIGTVRKDAASESSPSMLVKVGAMSTVKLSNPASNPGLVATCMSACTQTWGYAYTAVDPSGNETTAGAANFVLNNAILNGSNYNAITVYAVTNATRYNVYRTVSGGTPSSTGYIGTVYPYATTMTLVDNGLLASGSTPTYNATGAWNGVIVPIAGGGLYFPGQNIGLGTCLAPSIQLCGSSTFATQSATLGIELTASGDTFSGTGSGWTGTYGSGFAHTATGSSALVDTTATIASSTYYEVSFTLSAYSAGSVTVSVGGVASAAFTANCSPCAFGPKTTGTGSLTFTPTGTFVGTISNLSVRAITPYSATWAILDASGTNNALEFRANAYSLGNTWAGTNAGTRNTAGVDNTAFGAGAAQNNTTGGYGAFFGYLAGNLNTTGNFNSCFGEASCYSNLSGGGNSAIGQAALYHLLGGNSNVAAGTSAGFNVTSGSANVMLGNLALYNNQTGSNNVAIGGISGNYIGDGSTAVTAISSSIFIGQGAQASTASSDTNEICIAGVNCKGKGSNTTEIGNASTVATFLEGINVKPLGSNIVSANTIAPTTQVFHVTGNTAIVTIAVPTACTTSGYSCQLTIIPDGLFSTTTAGNIAVASTAVVSKALTMTYDSGTAKWYPSY